jgi:hypothetical protein
MRTPISINVFSALSIAAITLAASPASNASIFISTSQSGAQVQCDEDHTQHWTYSVSQDVADISGASLTMKRGRSTTASISFAIYEGSYSQFGSAKASKASKDRRLSFSAAVARFCRVQVGTDCGAPRVGITMPKSYARGVQTSS